MNLKSFIVNKADKFPLGAVLKSASWKAPATNFARANLLDASQTAAPQGATAYHR